MTQKLTTFYIVRHGQTDYNAKGLLQGHSNIPLNETGKRQAKEIANTLMGIHFDVIFSSDLERAVQTIDLVAKEKHLIVHTTDALREKHYGRYEGRVYKEIQEELKELFEQRNKLSDDEQMKFKIYHDGESDHQAVERLMLHLREIAVAYPGKTILIGSHGGIMRYFLIKLGWATYRTIAADGVKNSGYIKVSCDGLDFFIEETHQIQKSEGK